ncbi:MAG: hypothetical protein WBE76_03870 [Terracidiphilus sp.]
MKMLEASETASGRRGTEDEEGFRAAAAAEVEGLVNDATALGLGHSCTWWTLCDIETWAASVP